MSTLFGNNISQTYQGLIKLTDSTTGVTSVTQSLQDGLGNNIPIQVSNNTVNISGSFLVNGQPISVNTGSLVTTSSFNAYTSSVNIKLAGLDVETGSLQNQINQKLNTGSFNTYTSSIDTRIDGIELKTGSYATTGSNQFLGNQAISGSLTLTGPIIGSQSIFLQPDANDARYVEIYNTSPTDTHITASGGQIFLGDDVTYVKVDNYGSVERIDIVAGNELVVSSSVTNLTGSLHQSGTFYPDQVDWINSSIQLGTGSYILTTNVSGVTEYDTYQNVATALQQYINTGSFSTDGLITTGSVGGTQSITGSLNVGGTLTATSASITYLETVYETASVIYSSGSNQFGDASDDTQTLYGTVNLPNGPLNINGDIKISGSIIGGTVNNGLIKIQSETNKSSSLVIPFGYISSSNPDLQTNIMLGTNTASSGSGLLTNQTGSIVISGSNNIILNSNRTNTLVTQGTYGYIGGNGNIGNVIPTLGTGSLLRPVTSFNFLNSALSLQFTTSSLGQPQITNNLIYNGVTLNHQSGSVNFGNNALLAGGLTSTQNITTPNTVPVISTNLFTSNLGTTLSHNSSSILYTGNIGAVIVTNNYSSSVSAAVDNIAVNQNIFNGNSISLVVTGSNTSNRRTFNSNLVNGRSNLINSNQSGSSAGHLVSTAILGEQLIVSASHTSTSQGGSVFVGRFNATGSLQESSQDAVFVVGTGTAAGNRRNAIHVDNANNTRITGSVSISGSLSVNGVTPLLGTTGLITTGSANNTQIITGSVQIGPPNNAGHSPSLIIGSFNQGNKAANITGSVDISGSVNVTGSLMLNGAAITSTDRNGLITTGSNADGEQYITGALFISSSGVFNKGGINITTGENTGRINAANGDWLYRNTLTRNTVVGEVKGVNVNTPFESGSQTNLLFTGFFLGFTSGSQNTIIAGNGGANFVSGSNNTILGGVGNLEFGNNNLILGGGRTSALMEGVISIGTNTSPDLLYKSGSVVQMGYSTQITGSLDVSSNTILSSSLKVLGDVQFASGSNKTMGTVALDGANPGTATVSNTLVTANSLIYLTKQTNNHPNAGPVVVSSKGTNTFTITSNHNGDTDTVAYLIINPA